MALLPGMRVVVVHPPAPVKRTWRERLFSRPWRPLKAYRKGCWGRWDAVERSGGCLQYGDTLFVTPKVLDELKRHVPLRDSSVFWHGPREM